jgi:hypothetical protein
MSMLGADGYRSAESIKEANEQLDHSSAYLRCAVSAQCAARGALPLSCHGARFPSARSRAPLSLFLSVSAVGS